MMTRKPFVLVIDDSAEICALIGAHLEHAGYTTSQMSDGAKALRAAATTRPDLVVIDLSMPDTDGFEIISQLRAHHTRRELPIIVLSSCTDDESQLRAFALGVNDYVKKDAIMPVLLARVAATLDVCGRETGPDQSHALSA